MPLGFVPADRDLEYIGSLFDGLPVLADDRVRATLFGNRSADFKVAQHDAGRARRHRTTDQSWRLSRSQSGRSKGPSADAERSRTGRSPTRISAA